MTSWTRLSLSSSSRFSRLFLFANATRTVVKSLFDSSEIGAIESLPIVLSLCVLPRLSFAPVQLDVLPLRASSVLLLNATVQLFQLPDVFVPSLDARAPAFLDTRVQAFLRAPESLPRVSSPLLPSRRALSQLAPFRDECALLLVFVSIVLLFLCVLFLCVLSLCVLLQPLRELLLRASLPRAPGGLPLPSSLQLQLSRVFVPLRLFGSSLAVLALLFVSL